MNERHKLEWVQKNRTRTERVQLAGALIGKAVARLSAAGDRGAAAIAKMIESDVDDTFRRHCRVVGTRGGALVIHVDEAGLLYPMRQRWSGVLGEVFALRCGGRANVRIRFELGNAGVPVGHGR